MKEQPKQYGVENLDRNWYERNDVTPGIDVHQTLEAALDDITSTQEKYPVVEADPNHPLRINLFQDDSTLKQLGGDRFPGRLVFCSTPELRNRVIAAIIGRMGDKSK